MMYPPHPLHPRFVPPTGGQIVDIGTTAYFAGNAGDQTVLKYARDTPRGLVAYVYWDPIKNNPTAAPISNYITGPGLPQRTFGLLGTMVVGNQQTTIEYKFDIPYGQLLAIPVVADHVEVRTRLIEPLFGQAAAGPAATLSPLVFNDPPALVLGALDNLPNINATYPRGFVAISGFIGEGTIGGTGAEAAITRRLMLMNLAAAGGTRNLPMAQGVTHVSALSTAPLTTVVTAVSIFGGVTLDFPISTANAAPQRLPNWATFIRVTNNDAAVQSVEVVQYQGL